MSNKKLLGILGAVVVVVGVVAMLFSGTANESTTVEGSDAQVEATIDETVTEENEVVEEAVESDQEGVTLVDGNYRGENEVTDEAGWKSVMELTVKDGKIESVNFEEINESNEINSENAELKDQLEAMLVEVQDPSAIQVSEADPELLSTFQTFATQLLAQAQTGATDILIIK